ncbi:MAG: hypothetical protein Q7J08_07195 [Methanocorpusculum sp.]|uniref:hypothetical protein n=1 Tax=Methanocorpusculum sp. TaxID=2058474 RepID=UPI0027282833|nr:hypothetical protein [Methanocorpusculum sp.]MDO9523479.1 hypothetical protein [Methanocorpusculum sp.]
MSTISKSKTVPITDKLCQGDVFQDVKYCYIDSEDEEGLDIIEYTFPYAIIISQACDTTSASDLVSSKSGKATKYMPSLLLCPIYDEQSTIKTEHLEKIFESEDLSIVKEGMFNKDERHIAQLDMHYRFHNLTIKKNDNSDLLIGLIDFKHYFTLPVKHLLNNRDKRLVRLEDIFAEQITLKYCAYLARVAIP